MSCICNLQQILKGTPLLSKFTYAAMCHHQTRYTRLLTNTCKPSVRKFAYTALIFFTGDSVSYCIHHTANKHF